jgi:hypothetical protein
VRSIAPGWVRLPRGGYIVRVLVELRDWRAHDVCRVMIHFQTFPVRS